MSVLIKRALRWFAESFTKVAVRPTIQDGQLTSVVKRSTRKRSLAMPATWRNACRISSSLFIHVMTWVLLMRWVHKKLLFLIWKCKRAWSKGIRNAYTRTSVEADRTKGTGTCAQFPQTHLRIWDLVTRMAGTEISTNNRRVAVKKNTSLVRKNAMKIVTKIPGVAKWRKATVSIGQSPENVTLKRMRNLSKLEKWAT